ncbi:hypothetical protein AA15669_0720 [Saccharibacter floricola DSM 15669]|uniref:Uncharacterized protein n=1 Tax=Saccharibacter floricola DSM 15669 TaxID=1123227 RepID=A0ABQ0P133_9PROT|nr:hypothetical protein AA15669_0720 [Saccharibacter floricola DSM 15669]
MPRKSETLACPDHHAAIGTMGHGALHDPSLPAHDEAAPSSVVVQPDVSAQSTLSLPVMQLVL